MCLLSVLASVQHLEGSNSSNDQKIPELLLNFHPTALLQLLIFYLACLLHRHMLDLNITAKVVTPDEKVFDHRIYGLCYSIL